MAGADQRAQAPGGGDAEGDQERQPNHAAGTIGFAPRLEHGDQSNGEQHHSGYGKNLDPHGNLPWPLPATEPNGGMAIKHPAPIGCAVPA
jgi:hypothetical protein